MSRRAAGAPGSSFVYLLQIQDQSEAATIPFLALHCEISVHVLDNCFANVKSQTVALRIEHQTFLRLCAEIGLEKLQKLFLVYTNSVVGDCDLHLDLPVRHFICFDLYFDNTAEIGEFDSIWNQIDQNLLYSMLVN